MIASVAVFVTPPADAEMTAKVKEGTCVVEIVKLGIFVVFGSLLSFSALFRDGWAAVAIVAGVFLLIRPLSILVSLVGVRLSIRAKLFIGWFGPDWLR